MTTMVPTQPALPGMPLAQYVGDETPDSSSDELFMPAWVLALAPVASWSLDPFSPPHRPVPAHRHYVLSDGFDGFVEPWDVGSSGTIFLNPPYSTPNLPRAIERARRTWEHGEARVILALIPARPGSDYWHKHIWGVADVGFFNKRIAFDSVTGPTDGSGKFDSAFVLWTHDWRFRDELKRRSAEKVRWVH